MPVTLSATVSVPGLVEPGMRVEPLAAATVMVYSTGTASPLGEPGLVTVTVMGAVVTTWDRFPVDPTKLVSPE